MSIQYHCRACLATMDTDKLKGCPIGYCSKECAYGNIPSLEEIADRAAVIRDGWSPTMELIRRGVTPSPYTIPFIFA